MRKILIAVFLRIDVDKAGSVPTKVLKIPITFGRKDLEKLAHKCERGCDTYEEIGTRVHCDVFVTVHGMSAALLC